MEGMRNRLFDREAKGNPRQSQLVLYGRDVIRPVYDYRRLRRVSYCV